MNDSILKKEYYSMGEVCDLTGLKPHVLRYWETQFDVLHPVKNRAGNRVFRAVDIEYVLLVKRLLYDEKYTIEGARQKVDQHRKSGDLKVAARAAMAVETLTAIEADCRELLRLLDPDATT